MKLFDKLLRSKLFKASLRFKVMVVFIFPMILILSALSYMHNTREQAELEEQIKTFTMQLGDITLSNLRHAMLLNDSDMIGDIFQNIKEHSTFERIWIVNPDFLIVESTNSLDIGAPMQTDKAGCVECHDYSPADRPRVAQMRINEDILRVVTPIRNDPECQACHSAEDTHLGVLIIDAPLTKITEHMREDQIYNISISLLSILLVAVLAYMLIQWLIVKRVGVLYDYLTAFAAGNFSVRIPKIWRTEDEITRLADHFNAIADALERHQKEQREIVIIRQEAIAEERERIANELHDGVAQLLAYLNTKITTVRLLLTQQNSNKAETQLMQMEDAISKQVAEVRAAIIGLKLMEHGGTGLSQSLKEYVAMYRRLSDCKISLDVGDGVESLRIDPELEIHILRIVQEALSNVRKHASASEVKIKLLLESGEFLLTIEDDGVGFDPWQTSTWKAPHFGLSTMGKRAEKIEASFKIVSEPGKGALVSLRLKI